MTERPAPRFDWFIPIDGDGAHIGTRRAERPPTFEAWEAAESLMSQVAERVVAQRQAAFAGTPMVGQQAQLRSSLCERAPPASGTGSPRCA
jgi:hypothetical protein